MTFSLFAGTLRFRVGNYSKVHRVGRGELAWPYVFLDLISRHPLVDDSETFCTSSEGVGRKVSIADDV